MRKAPFLKFYTSDWRSGTMGLSFELKGFYIDLLALMWDRQSRLPNDPEKIAVWLQCDPRKVRRLLAGLADAGKVIVDGGEVSNRRLDEGLREHRNRRLPREIGENSKRSQHIDREEVQEKSAENISENSAKSNVEQLPLTCARSRSQKPEARKKDADASSASTDALTAFHLWNETAQKCGLAQATSFTPERRRKIAARLREVGLDGWKQALSNIEKSAYLTGGGPNGWRAELKFFLRPDNFHKVYDGGYGNGRHAGPKPKIEYLDADWIREARANMDY